MKTVVITGIGGDIAQSVATIIAERRSDLRLVGVDMHDQHGGALFVSEFIRVPSAGSPNYVETIKGILAANSVDLLIPMTEPELVALEPLIRELGGQKCVTSGARVVAAGVDKLATMEALRELGLPVPWTFPVGQGMKVEYPCILKARLGSGSREVFVVRNDDELACLADRYPDSIVQEKLEPADREVTCAVYRRRDGAVTSLLMLRRLAGGFTSWAKVIKDDAAARMCRMAAEGLGLRGSMNVQLRLTDRGPRIFEINPRFSSTALMRHRIGFSDVLWAIDEAEGKAIRFPEIPENQVMVRVQGAAVIR